MDARWPYGSISVVGGRAALRAWVGLGLAQEYAPRGGVGLEPPFYSYLRVPRFNSTMFYDPIMSALMEAAVANPSDDGRANCATFVPLTVGLLLAIAATKFTL